ncbi:MAG: amidohydrolase family protein, partial [Pseudomonadota bacterium]
AATLEPAKFFGLEQEMGSITVDQKADLVLLTADPQVSIGNTNRLRWSSQKGEWSSKPSRDVSRRLA